MQADGTASTIFNADVLNGDAIVASYYDGTILYVATHSGLVHWWPNVTLPDLHTTYDDFVGVTSTVAVGYDFFEDSIAVVGINITSSGQQVYVFGDVVPSSQGLYFYSSVALSIQPAMANWFAISAMLPGVKPLVYFPNTTSVVVSTDNDAPAYDIQNAPWEESTLVNVF